MSVYHHNPFAKVGNGPDVSSYQPNVDWSEVAKHCAFAFCKASEGVTFHDPTFAKNWQALKDHNLWRGAYHFAHPGTNSSQAEAEFFIHTVESAGGWRFGKRDLPPVLDLETEAGANTVEWAHEFLKLVSQHTKQKKPILYTGPGYWNALSGSDKGARAYLWQAEYGPAAQHVNGFKRYDFWQHTDGQVGPPPNSIPGIGNCDVSLFRGNFASLHLMCV